jgi:hypothetical protein
MNTKSGGGSHVDDLEQRCHRGALHPHWQGSQTEASRVHARDLRPGADSLRAGIASYIGNRDSRLTSHRVDELHIALNVKRALYFLSAQPLRYRLISGLCVSLCDIGITPESRHVRCKEGCPLSANSGHREHRTLRKEWSQVRFSYYGPRSAIKMPTTRYRPRNPPSSRHIVWKNRNDVRENPSRR